jgi:imidazolonepropionase-like amidohydrolase
MGVKIMRNIVTLSLALIFLQACTQQPKAPVKAVLEPFKSTYKPMSSQTTLLTNATLLIGNGERLDNANILLADGKIVAVGKDIKTPANATIIDAKGRWITPGLIDNHSHLGVYPSPRDKSTADGNEMTTPDTANVWAEHSVWPQDPGFNLARAGGITSMQVLPGSGNLIGGRGVVLKNVPATSMMAMKFPNAQHSLKMACGENPKRVYGSKGVSPATRMGNMAGYRKSWIEAQAYRESWDSYNEKVSLGKTADKPVRDLRLETLAEVLRGNIRIHNHCYRADEMLMMIALSKEFGYKIASFHHAIESYKIAEELAAENVCSSMWSDWWGFKLEAFDGIKENIAMVDQAGACAIVHSDSGIGIQHLNQDAAKAMASGNKAGFSITEQHAIRWVTSNVAKSLGVYDKTGSLEPGKMADVVIWSGNPFSVYTRADQVYIDGALAFDRHDSDKQALSDYELGLANPETVKW